MSADEPTRRLPAEGEDPTEVMGGSRGFWILAVSVVASLALVGAYLVAGGPVGPDRAADPCDARPWTDPQGLEEATQQFALSAADGAACELGVSREELTRSITGEETREKFMEEHDLSQADLEDALRAGLNRAVDDAETAGALNGLAATGLRAAIRVMPMSVMIDLLSNADSIFSGDIGSLGETIDAISRGVDELGSGSPDEALDGLGAMLEEALPEGTTEQLERIVPEETRRELEERAREELRRGLDGLLGP